MMVIFSRALFHDRYIQYSPMLLNTTVYASFTFDTIIVYMTLEREKIPIVLQINELSQACHYLTNTHHKHILAASQHGSYGRTVDTLSSKSTDTGDRRLCQKTFSCYERDLRVIATLVLGRTGVLATLTARDAIVAHTDICDHDDFPANVFSPGCADDADRFAADGLQGLLDGAVATAHTDVVCQGSASRHALVGAVVDTGRASLRGQERVQINVVIARKEGQTCGVLGDGRRPCPRVTSPQQCDWSPEHNTPPAIVGAGKSNPMQTLSLSSLSPIPSHPLSLSYREKSDRRHWSVCRIIRHIDTVIARVCISSSALPCVPLEKGSIPGCSSGCQNLASRAQEVKSSAN